MTAREIPPRAWDIDDLLDLGKKSSVTWLKAVPVLILEEWVKKGKKEGEANFVRTKPLASRIERCGLHPPFKPKGTSTVLGALRTIQKSRNLTRPPLLELIEPKSQRTFRVNLPHYEPLLQQYRQEYRENYSEDYKKLFSEGEPDWGTHPPKGQVERREVTLTLAESELPDEVQRLLAQVQEAVARLAGKNKKLQAALEAKTREAPEVSFVHTSPDFHLSLYKGKVTSIKDTIGDMLQRANHFVRISTRQMDMFADELIALKRRNPDLEIIVLSRGPERASGDRKRLAGVAFEKMKQAGIKLPIEKDALHSRVVVVDDQEILVSSADLDFTQMDLEFNAGVWTNNPEVITEAIRYFDNLLQSPTVIRPQ